MADVKLGEKHTCAECGAKFYDLGKPNAVCPKCGTPLPQPEPTRGRKASKSTKAKKDDSAGEEE